MKFDVVRSESSIMHVSPFNSVKKRGGVALRRVILFYEAFILFVSRHLKRANCKPHIEDHIKNHNF